MPNTPMVIDLFSGVGGLSLSAVKSGFGLKAAVEQEERILSCHAKNFPNSDHICADVSSLTGKSLAKFANLGKSELAGLIGGPPCQGFSTIGRRIIEDQRNLLFVSFFKLVSELKPAFFLAENVPGILNEQYGKIRNKARKLVEGEYQFFEPIKIVANDFGAATTRTRIFFIGIRNDMSGSADLLKAIGAQKTNKTICVKDALDGLPWEISEDWLDYESSWRKIDFPQSNGYFVALNKFEEGIGDPIAINRYLRSREVSGCFGTVHSVSVQKRFNKLTPGERDKISRMVKLKAEGLCPTLRAGTDNTKGSYQSVRPIHPYQPRVITPREAARLQGFPDWFQFHETKWHSFRQIGNSVCPVAAEKILSTIKEVLNM